MSEYVAATMSRPKIVITVAEGDAHPSRSAPPPAHDGLSTDDSLSQSSQAGSFETALDDVIDTVLPGSLDMQAKLSAHIIQMSPHMSHCLQLPDRFAFSSSDSLLSLPCPSHDKWNGLGSLVTPEAPQDSWEITSFVPDAVFPEAQANHVARDGSYGDERHKTFKRLERKQTNESFHSVDSTLHNWQT